MSSRKVMELKIIVWGYLSFRDESGPGQACFESVCLKKKYLSKKKKNEEYGFLVDPRQIILGEKG